MIGGMLSTFKLSCLSGHEGPLFGPLALRNGASVTLIPVPVIYWIRARILDQQRNVSLQQRNA
jgi:Cu/Ag efflux pump CusA